MAHIPGQSLPSVLPDGGGSPYMNPTVNSAAFGGGVAQALGQAGDVLAEHAVRFQNEQNETNAEAANNSFMEDTSKLWNDYSLKVGKEAVDGYGPFQKALKARATQGADALPNEVSRKLYLHSANAQILNMEDAGSRHAGQQNREWMQNTTEARASVMADQAMLFRNDPAKITQYAGAGEAEVRKLAEMKGLPPEAAEVAVTTYKGKLYSGIIDSMAETNLGHARSFYASVKDKLGGTAQAGIEANLKRAGDTQAILIRGDVDRRVNDNLASLSATGHPTSALSDGEIRAAYPKNPEQANYIIRSLKGAQAVGATRQNITLTSPDDDRATVDSYKPNLDAPDYAAQTDRYNAVQTAVAQKYKALADDPAAYVVNNNPKIDGLYQQALQNPGQMPAYVSAIDAAYEKLGVSQSGRTVLPEKAATGFVKQIMGGDGTSVTAQIDRIRNTMPPDMWNRVYSDLVTKGKLPAIAQMAAEINPADSAAKDGFGVALKMGDEIDKLVPKEARDSIDTAVDNSLDKFRISTQASGAGGEQAYLTRRNATVALAKQYIAGGVQTDPEAAAENAAHATVNWAYDFSGDGWRVLKAGDGSSRLDLAEENAQAIKDNLKPEELAILPADKGLAAVAGADEVRRQYAAQPKEWRNLPNDGGLALYYTGSGLPVIRDGGKPVVIDFDAMKPVAPNGDKTFEDSLTDPRANIQ